MRENKGRTGLVASDHWETPEDLFENLNSEFNFDFDPCPLHSDFDGLKIDWKERNFINPPYNRLDKPKFIEKAVEQWNKGKLCVLLIPAATGNSDFHRFFWDSNNNTPRPGVEIRFIKGRVAFKGINTKGEYSTKNKGMHDSMIVILTPNY